MRSEQNGEDQQKHQYYTYRRAGKLGYLFAPSKRYDLALIFTTGSSYYPDFPSVVSTRLRLVRVEWPEHESAKSYLSPPETPSARGLVRLMILV